MSAEADRPLGEVLHHYDRSQLWFQLAEIVDDRAYLQHGIEVAPGAVVFDVGANVGVAAAFFASHCRAGLVHCFEPVAPLAELLRRNLHDFEACVVHDYGLSAADGEAEITYYPGAAAMSGLYADPAEDRALVRTCLLNSGMSEAEVAAELAGRYRPLTLPCTLRTVSTVIREQTLERIDLLKIDVEKAELDVLAGIEDEDWARIGQVVAEVHDERGRGAEIEAILRGRGFAVTTDQEAAMRGTAVRMVYASRG
jgi:FkbM family methyltransferase